MLGRAVEVWCRGGYGSGYLVDQRHVLTALHVVADGVLAPSEVFEQAPRAVAVREELKIRVSGEDRWWPCRVAWPQADANEYHDVALLEISSSDLPDLAPSGWGRLTTSTPKISCEFIGFPRVQQYATPDPAIVVRASEHMTGVMNLQTGLKAGYLFVYPDQALGGDPSSWSGVSGAGVLCNDLLTAVVVGAQMDQRRLFAVPVAPLLNDDGFLAALTHDGETTWRAESVELAPFTAPRLPVAGAFPASASASFASLLRADEEAVTFHGRDEEIRQLSEWCEGQGFSVRLLIGTGGVGKTRLARQFMNEQSRTHPDWSCGFIGRTDDAESLATYISRLTTPTLLVVDYAETLPRTSPQRIGQIEQIITAGAGRSPDAPLRLMLIARSAGDWWQQIVSDSHDLDHYEDAVPVMELSLLDDSSERRQGIYRRAWVDLLHAISRVLPNWEAPSAQPITYPDLGQQRYGNPLLLQMEALASLLDPTAASQARRPEEVILNHERRYWQSAAAAAEVDIHPRTQRRAVAGASLYGAETEQEALSLIAELPSMPEQYGDLYLRIALWLHDLYPPPKSTVGTGHSRQPPTFWGSLQPDLLGEYLIGDILGEAPDFVTQVLREASAGQIRQALTILSRAGVNQPALNILTSAAVAGSFRVRLQAITVIAETENPEPLLEGITALQLTSMPIDELTELVDAIPAVTSRLAHFAVESQRELSRRLRALAASEPETYLPRLAESLSAESERLRNVGRVRQAQLALEEAAAYTMQLQRDDGIPAHKAAALYTELAIAMSDNGHPNEALQYARRALAIYEQLTDDEFIKHLIGIEYIRALQVAAIQLDATGDSGQALTVSDHLVDITRSAARELPGWDSDDYLATALHSRAIILRKVDHLDEAIRSEAEAAGIRRSLAREWPDVHLPRLAQSLSYLGACRIQSGDMTNGLDTISEALNMLMALCASNPAAYLPNLIICFQNLTQPDPDVPLDHAFDALGKVLAFYEELQTAHPNLYRPMLATTWAVGENKQRIILDNGTGRAETLDQADEAVSIYRQLYRYADRALYGPLFASALMDLADFLDDAQRHEDAAEVSNEALNLLGREISQDDPVAQRGVFDALFRRAQHLTEHGRYLEVLPFAREILAKSIQSQDPALAVMASFELIRCCRKSARLDEATEATRVLLGYISQAGLGPWTQLGAEVEGLLILAAKGQYKHVLAEVNRLRPGMERLPTNSDRPEVETPYRVREALVNIGGAAAAQLKLWDEALSFTVETVELRRARGAPAAEVAETQTNVVVALIGLGRIDEALSILEDCRQPLEEAHDAHALSTLFGSLAQARAQQGDRRAARLSGEDALRYSYQAGEVQNIADAHARLGGYLGMEGGRRPAVMAHFLASGLVGTAAGLEKTPGVLEQAAALLALNVDSVIVPADLPELCARVGEPIGSELRRLLTKLSGGAASAEGQLMQLITRIRESAARPARYARWLATWDPVIAGLVAEARGDAGASALLDRVLAIYLNDPDWVQLARIFDQIRNGERSLDISHLDSTDIVIMKRLEAVSFGRITLPEALWQAMGYGVWLGDIVAAARGEIPVGSAEDHLTELASRGLTQVSEILGRILRGERGAHLSSALADRVARAVITTVQYHINGEAEPPERSPKQ